MTASPNCITTLFLKTYLLT